MQFALRVPDAIGRERGVRQDATPAGEEEASGFVLSYSACGGRGPTGAARGKGSAVTKDSALDRLIARAQADETVLAVMLFGSEARGEATSTSDVDICLLLQPHAADQKAEKRLEYLGEFDLDVQVFQALPLPIRSRVLKEGRILLVKDEDALYALAFRTAQEFDDFRHIYEAYLEAVADGGS